MARFFGAIGYVETVEVRQGVYVEQPKEISYYGDILNEDYRLQPTENLNDDLVISNRISVVADAYAYENADAIRYAVWNGVAWTVRKIKIQAPRLILDLGGVYREPRPTPQVPTDP